MSAENSRKKPRTFYLVALFFLLVLGLTAIVYAISNGSAYAKAKRMPNPFPATETNIDTGMKIYMDHCESCHGKDGDGKGDKADSLSVAPGNFTETKKMSQLTDGQLYWQITKGRRPMPSFEAKLSAEQRWQTVDYIRTFALAPAGAPPPTQ